MYFDIGNHQYKELIPYIKDGIILDTSVIKIFIDGLLSVRVSRKQPNIDSEYQRLISIFELLKIQDKFDHFLITPHILTEVCTHLRNDYPMRLWKNQKVIFTHISPFLSALVEKSVSKDKIFEYADENKPIEIGDLSIMVIADQMISGKRKKTSILTKDRVLGERYKDHPSIMVMNFETIYFNLV